MRRPWIAMVCGALIGCPADDSGTGAADSTGTTGDAASSSTSGDGPGPVDGTAGSSSTTGTDAAPSAEADAYAAIQGEPLAIDAIEGLLANDVDPEGDALSAVAGDLTSAGGGAVSIAADGSFEYDAADGFFGMDSFAYSITDTAGNTASSTVTIAVSAKHIELDDLGDAGFAIAAEAAGDQMGYAVVSLGDVNGDGLGDVAIGAPYADVEGIDSGRAYVVFGKTDRDVVSLADVVDGIGGFAIDGAGANDRLGYLVGGGGDVDGDGLADITVTRWNDATDAYTSFVVFGKTDTDRVTLAELIAGVGGFAMEAELTADITLTAASIVPDSNGDGLDDVLVGMPRHGVAGHSTGIGYLVFGKADTAPVVLHLVADGTGGYPILAEGQDDWLGYTVRGGGDVDGDGRGDLLIGAPGALGSDGSSAAGRAYVLYGKTDTLPADLAMVSAGTGGGFTIIGAEGQELGHSVASAGDIDGDGFGDVLVGGSAYPLYATAAGRLWVMRGGLRAGSFEGGELSSLGIGYAIGGEQLGDHLGDGIAFGGDIDGDGVPEIIAGGSGWNDSRGRGYVLRGRTDLADLDLADLAFGREGFTIDGVEREDYNGGLVGGGHDIDGDGIPDVVIGALGNDVGGMNAGRAWVIRGAVLPPLPQ